MNPHSKHRPLIFTPRSPWGRLPLNRAHQNHMRASEDSSRELPEEDKDGRLQGKIESTAELHGKPENYVEAQVNSNSRFRKPATDSDLFVLERDKLKTEREEAQRKNNINKQRQQSQQQVQRYVNTAASAIDEGAAFLKKLQEQR